MCHYLSYVCLILGILYIAEASLGKMLPWHRWKWRLIAYLMKKADFKVSWRLWAAFTGSCLIMAGLLVAILCSLW
jgi:hypothetical protein